MKKYKICIIGDGLSGLITAQTLSKLDLEIDLISTKKHKKLVDNRTPLYHQAITNLSRSFYQKKDLIFFSSQKK